MDRTNLIGGLTLYHTVTIIAYSTKTDDIIFCSEVKRLLTLDTHDPERHGPQHQPWLGRVEASEP